MSTAVTPAHLVQFQQMIFAIMIEFCIDVDCRTRPISEIDVGVL